MATTGHTISTLANMLKTDYVAGVPIVTARSHVLFDKFIKRKRKPIRAWTERFTARTTAVNSIGPIAEDGYLPAPKHDEFSYLEFEPKTYTGTLEITKQAKQIPRAPTGALANLWPQQVAGFTSDWKHWSVYHPLCTAGDGNVGTFAETGSLDDTYEIYEPCFLRTSDAQASGYAAVVNIVDISHASPTQFTDTSVLMSYDEGVTSVADSATDGQKVVTVVTDRTPTVAADDYLVRSKQATTTVKAHDELYSEDKHIVGIPGIVNDGDPDTQYFGGQTRATWANSVIVSNSGTSGTDALLSYERMLYLKTKLDRLYEVGEPKIDLIWTNPRIWIHYIIAAEQSMGIKPATKKLDLADWDAVEFQGVDVVADWGAPRGKMYFLNSNDFAVEQSGPPAWERGFIEGIFTPVQDTTGTKLNYKATFVWIWRFVCARPDRQARLDDITQTVG